MTVVGKLTEPYRVSPTQYVTVTYWVGVAGVGQARGSTSPEAQAFLVFPSNSHNNRRIAHIRQRAPTLIFVWMVAVWIFIVLPALTAVLAVACALWAAARAWVWPVLALAFVNLGSAPFASGEWFYQRAEATRYQQAIASGDFTGLQDLLGRHDPALQPRMIGIALGMLCSVALLAWLRVRVNRGLDTPTAGRRAVIALVLLVGGLTLAQVFHSGTRVFT